MTLLFCGLLYKFRNLTTSPIIGTLRPCPSPVLTKTWSSFPPTVPNAGNKKPLEVFIIASPPMAKNQKIISDIFKVKSIPKLFWTSIETYTLRPKLVSCVMLVIGLAIFGLGEALLIAAGVGVSPWTVLAQGVSKILGWSVGTSTFFISSFVLFLWFPMRQKPGLGTILNIIIVALVLDFSVPYLPRFESGTLRILMAAAGVFITGLGGAIYLIANLGPGPRDGLMTGLQRITNLPIAWVRGGIEVTAVVLGWLLGGVVGVGTLLFAFGIGPALATSILILRRLFGKQL